MYMRVCVCVCVCVCVYIYIYFCGISPFMSALLYASLVLWYISNSVCVCAGVCVAMYEGIGGNGSQPQKWFVTLNSPLYPHHTHTHTCTYTHSPTIPPVSDMTCLTVSVRHSHACFHVSERVCVCVCVCVGERDPDCVDAGIYMRKCVSKRQSVCLCMCMSACVCV